MYLVLGSRVVGDIELDTHGGQETHYCAITAIHMVAAFFWPAGLLVRRSGGLGRHRRGNSGKGLMQDSGCKSSSRGKGSLYQYESGSEVKQGHSLFCYYIQRPG